MTALPVILALVLSGPSPIPRAIIHTDSTVVGHGAGGTVPSLAMSIPLTSTGMLECSPGAISCVTFDGRNNFVPYSSDLGNAAWLFFLSTSAAVPDQGDGYVWRAVIGGGVPASMYQTPTVPASITRTSAVTMRTPSGVGAGGVMMSCQAGTVSNCTCSRSDGGACTPTITLAYQCTAQVTNLTTTPVRVSATGTCASAITTSAIALVPGNIAGPTGTTWFSQPQLTIGGPAVYVATTTVAIPSVPLEVGSGTWSWALQGLPPALQTNQTPATSVLGGAGPFTDLDFYLNASASDPLDSTGDRYGVIAWVPPSATGFNPVLFSNGANGVAGYYFAQNGAGAYWVTNVPALTTVSAPGVVVANALNVAAWWRTGTSIFVKANLGTTAVNAAAGTEVAGTAYVPKIGRYDAALNAYPGQILGIVQGLGACPTPPPPFAATCEGWATYQMTMALGALGTQGETVTVTRATPETYVLPGAGAGQLLWTASAGTLAVGSGGAEVWAAGTNYALQSQTSCVANAVQLPWALNGGPTCVSDVALAPDGTVSVDAWTSSAAGDYLYQPTTTPLGTTFTSSVWASKPTGSRVAGMLRCTAGVANTCTCGTSDGSTCTPGATGALDCRADFTALTTVATRIWVSATCSVATISTIPFWSPDNFLVATGTARFWGFQYEPGLYPTPYIPTTTVAVARNATVATAPLPDLSTTNRWCIGVTATPGRPWNDNAFPHNLLDTYNLGAPDRISWYVQGPAVNLDVTNAGGSKHWGWTHGLGSTQVTKRLIAHSVAGSLAMYADGVAVGSGSGVGTGLLAATPSAIGIGNYATTLTSGTFDGSLANVKIKVNPVLWTDCQ